MTQQHCQIKRATILPNLLFPTRFNFQILAEFVCSQTQQSLDNAITLDCEPILCWHRTTWALPGQRIKFWPEHVVIEIMLLAVEMRPGASRRIGLCWNGSCNGTTFVYISCMYIRIVVVGHHINHWCDHTPSLVWSKTHWPCLDLYPDYRIIWE
jgi:hypothetical protein